MKYFKLFESFVNEAAKPRITIDASLWSGRKPEQQKEDRAGDQYVIYSNDIYGGKYVNTYGQIPSNVCILVQTSNMFIDRAWIKAGYGSEDKDGNKKIFATIGSSIQVTPEELKSDPKGLAKKIAEAMVKDKSYWSMNFQPYGDEAIFKIQKDVEKPALEVIDYAAKIHKFE